MLTKIEWIQIKAALEFARHQYTAAEYNKLIKLLESFVESDEEYNFKLKEYSPGIRYACPPYDPAIDAEYPQKESEK